jgi:perosamine synthetase
MDQPRGVLRIAKPYNDQDIENDVIAILRSGRLVQGEKVKAFESALASYLGCKFVIAVNSGTAALHSSIAALKMSEDSRREVITTPLSFAATANAIIQAGCQPVFCDVDSETFNIDPEQLREKVTKNTMAVEPVDVFGLAADLDEIGKIAADASAKVVEDAAEGIGAKYNGKRIGSISSLTCFSTYATKNLHTGEGGFVSTDDPELAERLTLIRNQGQRSRYNQTELGYNFRMTEIAAAIGLRQIGRLEELNRRRRQNARHLKEILSSIDCIRFQRVDDPENHAWYMFSVLLDEKKSGISRDNLVQSLKNEGVEADVAWPTPIHLQPYYRRILATSEGAFPNAEKICRTIFQLPIQPFLSEPQIDRIGDAVSKCLGVCQ